MKNIPYYGPLLAIALCVALAACDKEEDVPAFVSVPDVALQTDYDNQGSNSHNITDVWAFVDDQLLGVFGLPAEIPALHEGSHSLKLIAGIKKDGIASTRIQYPFYATYSTQVELIRDGNSTVVPQFSYFDEVAFWLEDFESVGHDLIIGSQSDTTLHIVQGLDSVIEGGASAGIFLDEERDLFRCHSDEDFDLSPGQPVFLELDYRSNNRILVGATYSIAGTPIDIPVLFINPSSENNKIYVDLSAAFSANGATNKEFYIEVYKENGVEYPEVYLDNIKLVRAGT